MARPTTGEHSVFTSRLRLRTWRGSDQAPFTAMNADPQVMRYFPATLTASESAVLLRRITTGWDRDGFGLWLVERKDDEEFIGFVGLSPVPTDLPIAPAVEIGWRLVHRHWGVGYAREAAVATVQWAFDDLGLDSLVSYTAAINAPSRRLMTRLGMAHDPSADFGHPRVSEDDPLHPHVVYRLQRPRRPQGR